MKRSLALAALVAATPAAAQLSANDLARVHAAPPPNAHLPARLAFTTSEGRRTTLGAVAGGRPALLIFADYTCRNVCAPGIVIAAHALDASGLRPENYRLIVVGIDPKDTRADARAIATKIAAMPAAARATTFLMGDPSATPAAARALGYAYAYDPAIDQFAHDASAYVFAGDGTLDAVLPELTVTPAGVVAAFAAPVAPPEGVVASIAHLCYGLAAAHGRFGRPIVLALQLLSAMLLLAFGGFLLMRRRNA